MLPSSSFAEDKSRGPVFRLQACPRHYPGGTDAVVSLDRLCFPVWTSVDGSLPRNCERVGSRIISFEACSAFTARYGLPARQVTFVTLYTEDSDGSVTFTAAPIATGWSDPLPDGYHFPLNNDAFSRRTQ